MRAVRIEQGSSLILDDLSATYAIGAFLCSCFLRQVKASRASVAQLVRARDCQSLGRRFDSVKNLTTQIPMNLNFIDPQTRVLNYF